jgi:tetratricopeptide (TPR) repeat protein
MGFLQSSAASRSDEFVLDALSDADVLSSLCSTLGELINSSPAVVVDEAVGIYRWLSGRQPRDYFFDERDYFLGEFALLAGASYRMTGRRDEAESWFDRSDANFRHTVAPAPHLARVAYNRLALRYDANRFDDVVELLPSAALTFEKLGMRLERAKCVFLEGMSLKALGRLDEAAARLQPLADDQSVDAALRGSVLVNLGNLLSMQGNYAGALSRYQDAQPLLEAANRTFALADLKAMFGETLKALGRFDDAIPAYRAAIGDLVGLAMPTRAAYFRVALAEVLIQAAKPREAEWEILAALPTIDEQRMVPEGFAAIALLRESVRQRKTDPKALVELREYLQAKN